MEWRVSGTQDHLSINELQPVEKTQPNDTVSTIAAGECAGSPEALAAFLNTHRNLDDRQFSAIEKAVRVLLPSLT